MDESIRTSTIPEAPEPQSDFRSHRQVADALVETITSGDDGLGIALTGTVGSGKSSIVERMKQELEDDSNTKRVFTYDIWVHRGDSIRRSFIEELARFLEEGVGWVEQDTAQKAKRYVLEQETESRSQITTLGATAAALLALLPPSLLLTQADRWNVIADHISFLWLDEIPTETFGAIVALGILAALLFGVGWIYHRRNDHPNSNSDSGQNTSLLDRETSITIKKADASTVDFRQAFEELVGSALDEDADRRLVIVIDNLDRFTPEDVYETWTNLQTFFELSTSHRRDEASTNVLGTDERDGKETGNTKSEDKDWDDRFWTILPFSPQAPYRLRKMLKGSEDAGGHERPDVWTPATPPFEEYIDKTFQLRFRVSPPVQSDFEAYFVQQLSQAIGIPDDQETVARVRDLFFRFMKEGTTPSGTLQPTPRTVNRFLNDLVGSIRQHDRTPPIPVQAYFLLLKRKYGDDLDGSKIREEDELDMRGVEPIIGARVARLRKQLLMLHYGVEEDKVAQILIRSKVQDAIDEGDHETIEEHESKVGFESIVREQVHRLHARTIGERIATAAVALKNVDTDFLPERCWSLLIEGIREVETVDVRSSTVGEGLNVLIDKQAEEEGDVEKLERSVLKLLRTMPAN